MAGQMREKRTEVDGHVEHRLAAADLDEKGWEAVKLAVVGGGVRGRGLRATEVRSAPVIPGRKHQPGLAGCGE